MLASERRKQLLKLIRSKGSVLVTDLERKLAVSRMTVYRDLDALESEGQVKKVHGGVIALEDPQAIPVADPGARPLEDRLAVARAAKRTIARNLKTLLADGRTAVVDNSSTAYFLSEALREDPPLEDLFLVTGGVSLYLALQRAALPGLRVALHGGEPHPRTGSLVGPLAIDSLANMRFDFAIISALGLIRDEKTVFVSNPEEGEVKRIYLERARRRVLAIDSSKLGLAGPYVLTQLGELDYLVTEKGIEKLIRGAPGSRRRPQGGAAAP